MNLEKWKEKLENGQCLEKKEILRLCVEVKKVLIEEPNVVDVSSPVVVVGDIHGQFQDLLTIFQKGSEAKHSKYIFLGDYVDRGFNSVETFTYLMVMKLLNSDKITLLRGNHESRQVTQIYGFHDECLRKYGTTDVWRLCCDVFDCLNIAAVIDNNVFCIHAGLSPDLNTIDQMKTLDRKKEIPQQGKFSDLMWSDPEDIETWNVSSRGAGWLYGSTVTKQFNHLNGLKLICRAHQVVQKGFKYHFNKMIATIWSAPNYCYRCENLAAMFSFKDADSDPTPIIFKEDPEVHKKVKECMKQRPLYFL